MFNYEKLTQDLFNELPTRKREVLEKRFGIVGGEPLTLQAIGDQIGITRERVRQIENDALAYIRETQTDRLQKPFDYFVDHLSNNGGLREENMLLKELGQDKFQNHVEFIFFPEIIILHRRFSKWDWDVDWWRVSELFL